MKKLILIFFLICSSVNAQWVDDPFSFFSKPLIEADATNYVNRVVSDAGTVELTIQQVSDYIKELKQYGLYSDATIINLVSGYKAGTLYSIKGSDFTVTRSTTGMRWNQQGVLESRANNVPRLNWAGGQLKGVLIEMQSTNLAHRSEDFDNAWWTKYISTQITSNQGTSPAGTTSADLMYPGANNYTFVWRGTGISGTAGQPYTIAVFVKRQPKKFFWLGSLDGSTSAAFSPFFNLETGAVSQVGTYYNSVSIKAVGNDWYYITATRNSLASSHNVTPILGVSDASGVNATITVNGTDGVLIWGAMLENTIFPTSYIPTTSASVTRNADVISKTSIPSELPQTEGYIAMEVNLTKLLGTTARTLLELRHNDDNRIRLRTSGSVANRVIFEVVAGGVVKKSYHYDFTTTGRKRIGIRFNQTIANAYWNGTAFTQATEDGAFSFASPLSTLNFGHSNETLYFNDEITNGVIGTVSVSASQLQDWSSQ